MAGYIGSKASVVSSGAERKKTFTITGATTSLTGLNYTVGKVHVFQNGVRLVDGTDYTATNGTTITLTVAAQNGDNVVVISQASYQVALSGIDDQSNATALTITSDENVLIGKSSDSFSTQGQVFAAGGYTDLTRAGTVLNVNRLSSDGDIVKFYKDGTAVGSIEVQDGTNAVFNSQGGTVKLATVGTDRYNFDLDQIYPTVDSDTNLGHPSYKFKDAYLSGGIYLGGAVAANKLDDYEEGTFTPTVTVGTLGDAAGAYTKIGDTVIVYMYMGAFSNRSSGSILTINNLPFTSANGLANGAGGSIFSRYCNKLPNATYVSNNSTNVEMYESATGNYDTVKHDDLSSVSAYFFIQVIYKTS